jgi:hypothetical protein
VISGFRSLVLSLSPRTVVAIKLSHYESSKKMEIFSTVKTSCEHICSLSPTRRASSLRLIVVVAAVTIDCDHQAVISNYSDLCVVSISVPCG